MIEKYVSFETAILAKKKGFNEPCKICFKMGEEHGIFCSTFPITYDFLNSNKILIPTQSLLARWLRKKYNLFIEIVYKSITGINGYKVSVYDIQNKEYISLDNIAYDIYEEAFEVGLQDALELIESEVKK